MTRHFTQSNTTQMFMLDIVMFVIKLKFAISLQRRGLLLFSDRKNKPTFSSSNVKPRPALILVLYLNVGQRTIGRRAPATGRGAICSALFWRAMRLRFFRPGWSNHVFT